MSNVVNEPGRELRRLAVRIEAGCGQFLKARGNHAVSTKWEALRHAWSLSNLTLRHTEATVLMARTDVVLQPSAWTTARAAVEATGRCLWLLEPEDEWEREARWLALVEEGARLGERREMAAWGGIAAQSVSMRSFGEAVAAKLPPGTSVPRTPTVKQMLESHGDAFLRFYALASQYAHGAELATRQWRLNLGIHATYGDFADTEGWALPLQNAWQSFRATALALIHARGGTVPPALAAVDHQIAEAQEIFVHSVDAAER